MSAESVHPSTGPKLPHMPVWRHILISGYWFGSNFVWGALLTIMLAKHMEVLAPKNSSTVLGQLQGIGALWALVIPLIAGPLSDRCRSKWGRRRPYVFWGGLVALGGMLGMFLGARMSSLPLFFVSYFVLQFGANTALASYSGVIPDLVPASEHGLASGIMALMTQLGTLMGMLLATFMFDHHQKILYGVLGIVFVFFLVLTLFGANETPLEVAPPPMNWGNYLRSLWDPMRSPDFAWVWYTRAMMMFGFYTMQPFILYFIEDVIHPADATKKFGMLAALILLAATFSGVIGGKLSDRWGRKPFVYASSGIMALMGIFFPFCRNLEQIFAIGLVFGLGYGIYTSVDWALGTDVLPSKDKDAAKDMGVWHVAMTLPQQIGVGIGGFLLGRFALVDAAVGNQRVPYSVTGYTILFFMASLSFAAGAYFIKNVKGVR